MSFEKVTQHIPSLIVNKPVLLAFDDEKVSCHVSGATFSEDGERIAGGAVMHDMEVVVELKVTGVFTLEQLARLVGLEGKSDG